MAKQIKHADYAKANKFLRELLNKMISKHLTKMGIPQLFSFGIIKSITPSGARGELSVADVYLNGSTTAATNIPVNPDIAYGLEVGDPVWVTNINFNSADKYVIARHNGVPSVGGIVTQPVTLPNGQTMIGSSGVLSELVFFQPFGFNEWAGWQSDGTTEDAFNQMVYLIGVIPDNFVVTKATLTASAMPFHYTWDGYDTWTNIQQAQLLYASGSNVYQGNMAQTAISSWLFTPGATTNITSAAWGGTWTPSAHNVSTRSDDVTSYLSSGTPFLFGVNSSTAAPTTWNENSGYASNVQLQLNVTGYKAS